MNILYIYTGQVGNILNISKRLAMLTNQDVYDFLQSNKTEINASEANIKSIMENFNIQGIK